MNVRAEDYAKKAAQADRLAREADLDGDWELAASWCELADNWRALEGNELASVA